MILIIIARYKYCSYSYSRCYYRDCYYEILYLAIRICKETNILFFFSLSYNYTFFSNLRFFIVFLYIYIQFHLFFSASLYKDDHVNESCDTPKKKRKERKVKKTAYKQSPEKSVSYERNKYISIFTHTKFSEYYARKSFFIVTAVLLFSFYMSHLFYPFCFCFSQISFLKEGGIFNVRVINAIISKTDINDDYNDVHDDCNEDDPNRYDEIDNNDNDDSKHDNDNDNDYVNDDN